MAGSVGIAPGSTTIRLPDGTIIAIADWTDRDHWATVDIRADYTGQPLDAFACGLGQIIPGSDRFVTKADYSLPRAGYAGLPQSYEFLIFGWRAAAIGPRDLIACDAAQVFFATTAVAFRYRERTRAELPLSELLRSPPAPYPQTDEQPVGVPSTPAPNVGVPAARSQTPVDAGEPFAPLIGRTFVLPIRIQEQLSFSCEITPQDGLAIDAIRLTLRHVGAVLSLRFFFSGLYKTPVA